MIEPVIRPATSADGAAVRALVLRILTEYGLSLDPHGTDADLDDIGAAYRGGRFWVLDEGGEIVGSCALYPVGGGAVQLRKMYLEPRLRGRGWGRRLLEQALAAARADGHRRVELETASVLKEAIRLYQQYGFARIDGCSPDAQRCDQSWALEL